MILKKAKVLSKHQQKAVKGGDDIIIIDTVVQRNEDDPVDTNL
jgi:hypothetical protein